MHASDAYYLPRDSTPHDWSPPNDESTQNTRGLPLRGSIDFRGVHSRASEVIVATSMIDSDYRYTQDAPQRDRSAILHGSGGQHPTAQPNQYATPLQDTLYRAALEVKQQQPYLLVDPHQAQQVYAAQSRAYSDASSGFGQATPATHFIQPEQGYYSNVEYGGNPCGAGQTQQLMQQRMRQGDCDGFGFQPSRGYFGGQDTARHQPRIGGFGALYGGPCGFFSNGGLREQQATHVSLLPMIQSQNASPRGFAASHPDALPLASQPSFLHVQPPSHTDPRVGSGGALCRSGELQAAQASLYESVQTLYASSYARPSPHGFAASRPDASPFSPQPIFLHVQPPSYRDPRVGSGGALHRCV